MNVEGRVIQGGARLAVWVGRREVPLIEMLDERLDPAPTQLPVQPL